jgi:hypothetical protein
MAEQEEDFSSLPLEDRWVHKVRLGQIVLNAAHKPQNWSFLTLAHTNNKHAIDLEGQKSGL